MRFSTSVTPGIARTSCSTLPIGLIVVPVSVTLPFTTLMVMGSSCDTQCSAHARLHELVGEHRPRFLGLLKFRPLGEQPHDLHARLDGYDPGVEHQVVEEGVLPVDAEKAAHDSRVRRIAALDLAAGGCSHR